jgi:CO dehydrogenase/acetyl-CoA synthase gamma subunit (corrinoid Fe-S protein)
MAIEKKPREQHYDEKLSINGSFEDVIRLSVTSDKSIEIRKAIIEAKKKDFGFDPSLPMQHTTFIWLEQNVSKYKREEVIAALTDMRDVEIIDSSTGAIEIPGKYFK